MRYELLHFAADFGEGAWHVIQMDPHDEHFTSTGPEFNNKEDAETFKLGLEAREQT